jgi:ribosomal-protein-serine acetyltransferase
VNISILKIHSILNLAMIFPDQLNNRHILRLICPDDAAELFALTDINREYLRQWLPWLDQTQSVDDTETFIELMLSQQAAQQSLTAVILYDGAIAGLVGHNKIDRLNHVGYIGYWLGAAYQGQGLMTVSCRALIEYSFSTLYLDRIVIACATNNHHSRAIPERLGFTHAGTTKNAEWLYDRFVDHEIYVLLQNQ